jgi:hypothetical protein
MNISVSKIKTFLQCPRKAVFTYMSGFPVAFNPNFAKGSIFHRILERWLSSDSTGRIVDGVPVEAFPPGWEVWEEGGRVYRLPEEDQELLRTLMDIAIDNGVITRRIGGEAEVWIPKLEVIPGVRLSGKCDYVIPREFEIQDHKTAKSRRYTLSKEALQKDLQVRIYTKAIFDHLPKEVKEKQKFYVRHNNFIKDFANPEVFYREVSLKWDEVEETWEQFKKWTKEYLDLEKRVQSGCELEDIPAGGPNACNAYGGCSFRGICGGTESPKEYAERIQRQIDHEREVTKVGIFDKLGGSEQVPVRKPAATEAPAET